MNPTKTKEFMQTYEDATARAHGYLLVDFKQVTQENKRLRSNIFEDFDDTTHVAETINNIEEDEVSHLEESFQRDHINMISCDDCGIVLESIHDLQKHLKTWCPMKSQKHEVVHQMIREVEEPLVKKRRVLSELECFIPLRIDISRKWKKDIDDGQQTYMEQGHSEEKARAKTINENIKEIRKDLRETYASLIRQWMNLNENSQIHQKVMARTEKAA